MCKHGETEKVRVKIQADLSSTGKEKWKDAEIDRCIAPIVEALQKAGIDMLGSCCRHNPCRSGQVHLVDGRIIFVADKIEVDELFRTRKIQPFRNRD